MSRYYRTTGRRHQAQFEKIPANETDDQRKLRHATDSLNMLKSDAINASKYTKADKEAAWKRQDVIVEQMKADIANK